MHVCKSYRTADHVHIQLQIADSGVCRAEPLDLTLAVTDTKSPRPYITICFEPACQENGLVLSQRTTVRLQYSGPTSCIPLSCTRKNRETASWCSLSMATPSTPAAKKPSPGQQMLARLLDGEPDVVLRFGTETLCGHATLLRLASGVLRNALEAHKASPAVSASKEPHGSAIEIPMDGTAKQDWLLIMEFIYPVVPTPRVTLENLEVLVQLAHKYEIPVVLHRADHFLKSHIVSLVGNSCSDFATHVWKWLTVADQSGLEDACAACVAKLLTEPKAAAQVCSPEALQGISPKTLHRLVGSMSQRLAEQGPGKAYCSTCKGYKGVNIVSSSPTPAAFGFGAATTAAAAQVKCGASYSLIV